MGDISNEDNHDRLRHRCAIRKKVCSLQEEDGIDNPVPATVVDTTADELKTVFAKSGIPIEEDFLSLIDLADVGRKAAGLDNANDKSGQGLELINDILQVKADPDGGITVSTAGVSIVGSDTITLGSAGAAVIPDTAKGITTGVGGVEIIPNMDKGMQVTTTGIGVITHDGIGVSTDGIAIDADSDKSVEVGAAGVGVVAGNGISVGASTVAVAPNLAQGVLVGSSGVEVNYGRGLVIDNNELVTKNQTTVGSAFPTSPAVGDIHYKLFRDEWEMVTPHGLNSGIDETIGAKGGKIHADGDTCMVTFYNGWGSTSVDKGRTWLGLRITTSDSNTIISSDLQYGLGLCGVHNTLQPTPVLILYISYNSGYSWRRIPHDPVVGNGNPDTARICGSRLLTCGIEISCRMNDDQGETPFFKDTDWIFAMGTPAVAMAVYDRTIFSISSDITDNVAVSYDAGINWDSPAKNPGFIPINDSAAMNNSGQCIIREGNNTLRIFDIPSSTWTVATTGLDPTHASESITCTAAFENKLYAAGTKNGDSYIYESIDGGVSFQVMTGIPTTKYNITGMDRTKDSFFFINNNNEVYRSFAGKYIYYNSVWNLS